MGWENGNMFGFGGALNRIRPTLPGSGDYCIS